MKAENADQNQNGVVFTGIPNFVKALIFDATHEGNGSDFEVVGRELARHAHRLLDSNPAGNDCESALSYLDEALAREDRAAVLGWFVRYFPRCMSQVPDRVRDEFVDGVFDADERDLIQR